MDIHPLHAVGFLHDIHFNHNSPILLDSNLSITSPHSDTHPSPFPTDPLHEQTLSTSLISDNTASDGTLLEHVPHPDDHILDKMISGCFDDITDPIRDPIHIVSSQTLSSFPTISRPQFNHPLMEEMDLILTPACPPPKKDSHLDKRNMSLNETSSRKKRGIQKEKRTRAPARPWTEAEHQRFEESLELFGRDWERCAAYIGTRRAQLVRSHAQKHLIKLWKLGKPLPKKVAESGTGYTLSGKPLLADSASARSYLTKIPCPNHYQKTK